MDFPCSVRPERHQQLSAMLLAFPAEAREGVLEHPGLALVHPASPHLPAWEQKVASDQALLLTELPLGDDLLLAFLR